MSARVKYAYGAMINWAGLYSQYPIRVVQDPKTKVWWSKDGNFDVRVMGEEERQPGVYFFASRNQEAVTLWLQGAKIAFKAVQRFVSTGG